MWRGHLNIVAVVFIKLLLKKFFERNLPKHFFLNEHGTISFVLCLKQIYQLKKINSTIRYTSCSDMVHTEMICLSHRSIFFTNIHGYLEFCS